MLVGTNGKQSADDFGIFIYKAETIRVFLKKSLIDAGVLELCHISDVEVSLCRAFHVDFGLLVNLKKMVKTAGVVVVGMGYDADVNFEQIDT